MTHRNLVAERINDSFNTFDQDTWLLKGDATYPGSRVRLTPAVNNSTGALVYRDDFTTNVWECRFRFDIEGGSADPADETALAWYSDGSSTFEPNGGYQVSYDHYDEAIRLDSFVDGEQKTLASASVVVPEDASNLARVEYTRGNVTVWMNGDAYIDYHIEDPVIAETLFFSARTGGENAAHYVDEVRLTAATDRNIKTVQEEWPSPAIDINNSTNAYKLMSALVSVLDEEDKNINQIKRAHHIDTAVDEELEQFGDLVQLDRKSGESDEKYRARLKVQYRVGNIGTAFDQFSQFASVLLDTNISNIEFSTNFGAAPATIQVSANPAIYDSVELTRTEVADFLGQGVPAGHSVTALERGTFRLKTDAQIDDAEKGLTSDSISTGGTLAADIV
jgi:hypothetical protein